MDNISPSDLDSNKREADLRREEVSCLETLKRTTAIQWGIRSPRKVKYDSKKANEVKPKSSLSEEGYSVIKEAENEVEETRVKVKQLSGSKRAREGSPGENQRKVKNPSRWPVARFQYAEKKLQEVAREMGATWNKPVLRNDLRGNARKQIGDTGLLDYLLKHMAGEVFADGKERLVRRHNTEGAIEYWLEPAELAQIRREAGIFDPYWIPPPGWKRGDAISNCNGDGHCKEIFAQEFNLLKSEIAELKSLKETEKSHVPLHLSTIEHSWEEKYQRLLTQHEKLQEQVDTLSTCMLSMKDEICLLRKTTRIDCSGQKHLIQEKEKGKQVMRGGKEPNKEKPARKSGFSICKPMGTFLWPNMPSASGHSPHSTASAMSPPPQLMLLPSPTSPLPPLSHAFFYQSQPDSQIQSQIQAQSHAALAQFPTPGFVHRPSARFPPITAMAPATRPNSEKQDDVSTDLALASFTY